MEHFLHFWEKQSLTFPKAIGSVIIVFSFMKSSRSLKYLESTRPYVCEQNLNFSENKLLNLM